MTICITARGEALDSPVDPRFEQCATFVFVESDTHKVNAVKNSLSHTIEGAGVRAGRFVAEKKTYAVITGSIGPDAFRMLTMAGIKIFPVFDGTVRQAVRKFKFGELKQVSSVRAAMRLNQIR